MRDHLAITKELSTVFKTLGHQDRIRIVEALQVRSVAVTELHQLLELPQSRVSQHLAIMRQNLLVSEDRSGRQVFYSLLQPDLAHWITDGLQFVEARAAATEVTSEQVRAFRKQKFDALTVTQSNQ